jgi:hypothetical protein
MTVTVGAVDFFVAKTANTSIDAKELTITLISWMWVGLYGAFLFMGRAYRSSAGVSWSQLFRSNFCLATELLSSNFLGGCWEYIRKW